MQTLNPVTLPLNGQTLIEASAGTGKTYTITGLYLRYLLGLQLPEQASQPLSVEQILVVTFTEAATEEIKDRVRGRIIAARDAIVSGTSADPLIEQVLAQVSDKPRAFELLDSAAKSMDEAAIFTIHGFCQRMLKQHAFESGVAFNLHFILDQSELIENAVNDFWRHFVYPLSSVQTQAVLAHFAHPLALAKKLVPLLAQQGAKLTPHFNNPEQTLAEIWQNVERYHQAVPQFKQQLLNSDFIEKLNASGIKGNAKPKNKSNVKGLVDFCHSDELTLSIGSAKHSYGLWTSENLSDPSLYKKGESLFSHPMSDQFTELDALATDSQDKLAHAIFQYANKWVKEHIILEKAKQALISPDDLLVQLHSALTGSAGDALAEKIAVQFPAAMIDEFQDTDPIQYGIFSRIYAKPSSELILIGDPKQAIYGFRGADIFTYIAAKNAVDPQRHFTLDTNYRSTAGLVQSVNQLFASHPNSFIFNRAIPFIEVNAKAASEQVLHRGEPLTPLHYIWHGEGEGTLGKADGQQALAAAFANTIAGLLNDAQQGQLTYKNAPLKAADFCVLVRDRFEAKQIKQALAAQGVASVYLAKESVFAQPLAQQLYRFLQVLHGQYDERALRGVLAEDLFLWRYSDIHHLLDDQHQWQQQLNYFSQLRECWEKQGAMATLERLLVNNNLVQKWQQRGDNVERRLTDYRHLGEILQQKQLELDGTQRLLHYFAQQLAEPNNSASQLRLESDANLVKIVTMHASKGLEYPLVFIPFALGFKAASEGKYHHQGELIIDLAKSEHAMQTAETERLAEDLRLLYVALTRAAHHCVLGLYPVGTRGKSTMLNTALGYLLFSEKTQQEQQAQPDWLAALSQRAKEQQAKLTTSHDIAEQQVSQQTKEHIIPELKRCHAHIERNWRSSSFSALSYHKSSQHNHSGADDENHPLDSIISTTNQQESQPSPYSFPKGANAGSCLHEIFELLDFQQTHQGEGEEVLTQVVSDKLEKFAFNLDWQPCVQKWIKSVLACPLNPVPALQLGQLTPPMCLVEMEFHLHLEKLSAPALNQILLSEYGYDPNLQFDTIKGMLKGFIDLIFCWQGKYYVLDYKSNYLGDAPSDYQHEHLELAMQSHQYHLQSAIYTVALHRLLQARLDNYDPKMHLGGSFYLFLRAMADGQGVYYRPVDLTHLAQLDNLFAKGVNHAG